MSEYWLISAPGDKTCQQTWDTLNNATSKQANLSANYKFHIPDLKVGTLDQLVGLSDDLGKLDTFVEGVTRKVAQYLGEVLEDQRDKLHENLQANNSDQPSANEPADPGGGVVHYIDTGGVSPTSPVCDSAFSEHSHGCWGGCDLDRRGSQVSSGRGSPHCLQTDESEHETEDATEECAHHHRILEQGDLPTYLTRFQWDMAKYPIKQSLRNIADIISKQVGQIDADLKTKSQAYNALKGSLQNLEKKQTGSLLTRNLADLVKKEHFILDSEFLTTLLVIVPKAMFNEWNATYEKIVEYIVPRSSQLIHQDHDFGLFTVTLFKKVQDEFKMAARERKFVVRDFSYNESELAAGKNEITKLVTDKKKQFGPLVRWLKVNFSECFCAWIHVKALRVFVESVLRYGLPVNFLAVVLVPSRKTSKRLRETLQNLYAHLDASAQHHHASAQDNVDIAGLGFGQSEYYPYVYYKLNIDMVDQQKM